MITFKFTRVELPNGERLFFHFPEAGDQRLFQKFARWETQAKVRGVDVIDRGAELITTTHALALKLTKERTPK